MLLHDAMIDVLGFQQVDYELIMPECSQTSSGYWYLFVTLPKEL